MKLNVNLYQVSLLAVLAANVSHLTLRVNSLLGLASLSKDQHFTNSYYSCVRLNVLLIMSNKLNYTCVYV